MDHEVAGEGLLQEVVFKMVHPLFSLRVFRACAQVREGEAELNCRDRRESEVRVCREGASQAVRYGEMHHFVMHDLAAAEATYALDYSTVSAMCGAMQGGRMRRMAVADWRRASPPTPMTSRFCRRVRNEEINYKL